LIELVHVDLELCLKAGERARVEDYLARYPELAEQTSVVFDLIAYEYELRQHREPGVNADEYKNRFPQFGDEVINVLHAKRGASSLHASPPSGAGSPPPLDFPLSTKDVQPSSEGPGAVIGPYKLLQAIGEGGFGMVYMAEQEHPVRRRVAVKILKPGMDTAQVIARFDAERQALAMMDHQNIARVLDAGATPTGRPYFAMELVRGVPVTKYCDDNHLTPRQRLELFVPICQAIQHAHQKGVIHRDIKPSNVLIMLSDGKPVPKVIDFGLAKALDQRLTEQTIFTQLGQVLGTLEYMSPEQADASGLDVDTRTDIYSLGVLLYELLTGTTPLERKRLRNAALAEVLLRIREEEPPKPSSRLSHSGEQLATISAQRKTEPIKLARLVRGELDWIVMKALEKDRTRRYETADSFGRDIERYLHDEPVEAGPPSATYRIKKFVRRNKGPVLAATTLLLLLIGGIVGTTAGLLRAQEAIKAEESQRRLAQENEHKAVAAAAAEQQRRKQARDALDLISGPIVEEWLTKNHKPLPDQRDFLQRALQSYEQFAQDTGDDPESRGGVAHAYLRVGNVRDLLGLSREAEDAYRRAIAGYAHLTRNFPTKAEYREGMAQCLGSLARCLGTNPSRREVEELHRNEAAIWQQLIDECGGQREHRRRLANCQHNMAVRLALTSQFGAAQAAFQRAIQSQERLIAEDPSDIAILALSGSTRRSCGMMFFNLGRYKDAEENYRAALISLEKFVARFPERSEERRDLAVTYSALGQLCSETKEYEKALDFGRKALELLRKLVNDFPSIARYHIDLSHCLSETATPLSRKDAAQARGLYEEADLQIKAALQIEPSNVEYLVAHYVNQGALLNVELQLHNHASACALLDVIEPACHTSYDICAMAVAYSNCARLADNDGKLSVARRKSLVKSYGDKAMQSLKRAIQYGYSDVEGLPAKFVPLQSRPDFQQLLGELKKSVK
jgi:serine/threonine protein kinase